jgi:hypothetical protein
MYLELEQIFSGGSATLEQRWHFANFFNRIFFCNSNDDIRVYDGTLPTFIAPGLPTTELRWDGCTVFANHVMVWKGNVIRWSDINDGTLWIPVGETSGTGVVSNIVAFAQPAIGSSVQVELDKIPTGWVSGTFIRIFNGKNVNYYTVTGVSKFNTSEAVTIAITQNLASGGTAIYTTRPTSFVEGGKIKVSGSSKKYTVKKNASRAGFIGTLSTTLNLTINTFGNISFREVVALNEGEYISVAPNPTTAATTGQDIYQIVGKVDDLTYRVWCKGVGSNLGSKAAGCNVIFQPAVEVQAFDTEAIPTTSALVEVYEVSIKREDTTGADATGFSFPQGSQLLPLLPNEAGQYRGSGGEDRGPIKACIVLGDAMYVCRNRGIESFQYTGRPEIFIKRDEITDEGLLGKYLWTKVGYDEAYFWGHRELYRMTNGQIEPVAQQVTKKMLREEFDASKVNSYFMFHNERDGEIWTFYSPKGQPNILKAMIYNYLENSCVFDSYPTELTSITVAGGLNFPDGSREILFGVANNTILNSGPGFVAYGELNKLPFWDRLGLPISSEATTIDLDFEDSMAYKYIDTLQLSLWVEKDLDKRPFKLWVSFGGKDNLDSKVNWTGGQWIDVSGTGNIHTKINQRVSGRFISLKFYSNQIGVRWKIASYVISGRKGSTY